MHISPRRDLLMHTCTPTPHLRAQRMLCLRFHVDAARAGALTCITLGRAGCCTDLRRIKPAPWRTSAQSALTGEQILSFRVPTPFAASAWMLGKRHGCSAVCHRISRWMRSSSWDTARLAILVAHICTHPPRACAHQLVCRTSAHNYVRRIRTISARVLTALCNIPYRRAYKYSRIVALPIKCYACMLSYCAI